MWWCKLYLILCVLHKTSESYYIISNYTREIKTLIDIQMEPEISDYPVVHTFIHKKVPFEWSSLILSTYSKKIPIVLFEASNKITKFSMSTRVEFHYVVLIFENPSDINVIKWKTKIGEMWKSHSKFIIWITGDIVYQKNNSKTEISQNLIISDHFIKHYSLTLEIELLQKLFQDYWSAGAANVLLVVFNTTRKNFDMINFNPFVTLSNKQRGKVFAIKKGQLLFPDKFINLYGYPITISIFQKPPYVNLTANHTEMVSGEDVEFIKSLQQKMNFTLVLKSDNSTAANYATTLPDGQSVGLTGDLLLNRSEVLGNSRYMVVTYHQSLDFLYPFDVGPYCAVVPRHPPGWNRQIIGKHLVSHNTLLYLLPFPILTLYLYLKNERHPILVTWNLLLNQRFLRVGPLNHDRIIRFTWIVFACLITCGFEGRLIKLLTAPGDSKDINTLHDLAESNLTLLVGDKMFEPINISSLPVKKKLAKKTRTNLNFSICSERLKNQRDVACATDKLSALLTLTSLSGPNSKYPGRLMKEEIANFWITYVVKKDLPYITRFDTLLRRLTESGIKTWASRKSIDMIKALSVKKRTDHPPTIVRIHNLSYLFGICFAGLCTSFFIFLGEILFQKRRRKKNNKAMTKSCK